MRREPVFDGAGYDGEQDDYRPLAAPQPFRRARFVTKLAFAAAVITGLSLAARDRTTTSVSAPTWVEPQRVAHRAAVRPAVPISDSAAILTIDVAPFEQPVRVDSPHWSAATGKREDGIAQGHFDTIEAPYLRMTVGEVSRGAEANPSLFVTLARRAAALRGLSVTRTASRGTLETKFGPFETVEMTLQGDGSRSCTGFQSVGSETVRIDGWFCGILGQAPEPSAVACSIDRLRLAGPANEPLETAFAEADRRRTTSCGGAGIAAAGPSMDDATGSIGKEKTDQKLRRKKSEAKTRQTAQARP